MDKSISVTWIKDFKKQEEAEKFTQFVRSSAPVLNRLSDILKAKADARNVFSEEDFKDPSWAYAAADRNGFIRAMQEVIKLITINVTN